MTPVRPPKRNVTRKPERPEHRRLEGERAAPHRADPVEELHPGRDRDEHRHDREERQQHLAGGVHVVRPDRHRQGRDGDRREDQGLVAEDRLAREDRQDLGDDAEERQRDDVDLWVPEEPEQVLPEHGSAVARVEHVRPEPCGRRPSASSAAASTGKAISTRIEVTRTVHVKIGIRNIVMPGARMQMIVVMKLTAPRIVPKPASARPKTHRSPPRPGL